jgi:hypothetical protein
LTYFTLNSFFSLVENNFRGFDKMASGQNGTTIPDLFQASIDRVLADVGIAPVESVLKSAAAQAAVQASLTPR